MTRWGIAFLIATAGCSLVTTQKIPLVLLDEVPVPAEARWAAEDEEEIGSDGGAGLLFLNFQADPTEGLFDTLETDEVEGAGEGELYYEGTETRTFFTLFALFFEGVSFDARVIRLKAKPLPPEVSAPVAPSGEPVEPEPVEPEPVEPEPVAPEPEPEPEAAVEPETEPEAQEPAVEEQTREEQPKKGKKKRRKKKKRKKRRNRGRK